MSFLNSESQRRLWAEWCAEQMERIKTPVTVKAKDVCKECNGSGLVEDWGEGHGGISIVDCPTCGGNPQSNEH